MAGKTGVSLNWGGLDKVVGRVAHKIANRKLLLESVGEALVSSTFQRFMDEEDPTGKKWEPSQRAKPTEDKRAPMRRDAKGRLLKGSGKITKGNKGGKTLQDTGSLRDSIDYATTPDSVMVGSNPDKMGTNKVYAAIHQFGGKAGRGRKVTIPARPFVGISKEDMEEVQGTIADFLADAFRGKP